MKRIGQMIKVKPEGKEAYIKWHANPLPGVNEMIKACNIQNYSIYCRGDHLFAYFEYVGEAYDADCKKMEDNPKMQEWWTHTKPCFVGHDKQEYYLDWKEIFYLA